MAIPTNRSAQPSTGDNLDHLNNGEYKALTFTFLGLLITHWWSKTVLEGIRGAVMIATHDNAPCLGLGTGRRVDGRPPS
ncbi:MAG TPA: hypothetical protein VIJ28_12165 [Chloroflexota bacterium]